MAAKKKTTSKKRRVTKKKKVTEASYDVTTKKKVAGSDQETTQTVDAPTASAALQKLQATNPQAAQDAEEVVVNKSGGAGSRVNNVPQISGVQPEVKPATALENKGKKKAKRKVLKKNLPKGYSSESYKYPYSVGLPAAFSELIEQAIDNITNANGVVTSKRFGRVYVTVNNPDTMDQIMEAFVKLTRDDDASKTKQLAETAIRGIVRS